MNVVGQRVARCTTSTVCVGAWRAPVAARGFTTATTSSIANSRPKTRQPTQPTSTSTSSRALSVAASPISNSLPHLPTHPDSIHSTATAATPSVLTDTHGRFHNYLRVSLTERCNLRCTYCMPEGGVDLTPQDELLSSEELIRVMRIFIENGVDKIRFTGGEPTVKKDLDHIMRSAHEMENMKKIGITTNGIVLARKLPKLVDAGLRVVNISLDTLDPDKFMIITRRNGHDRVLKAIDAVLEAGIDPPKVNCVVTRGVNDMEIVDFVELTRDKNLEVRFIEYMPFNSNQWRTKKLVSFKEMTDRIRERYPDLERMQDAPTDTSKTFRVPGFKGRLGFITSMTENFCGGCNRLRLTADGNLKVCLFGTTEVSLRDYIRQGASDEDLAAVIGAAVLRKKARHAGMEQLAAQSSQNRPMITIGG